MYTITVHYTDGWRIRKRGKNCCLLCQNWFLHEPRTCHVLLPHSMHWAELAEGQNWLTLPLGIVFVAFLPVSTHIAIQSGLENKLKINITGKDSISSVVSLFSCIVNRSRSLFLWLLNDVSLGIVAAVLVLNLRFLVELFHRLWNTLNNGVWHSTCCGFNNSFRSE